MGGGIVSYILAPPPPRLAPCLAGTFRDRISAYKMTPTWPGHAE